ncbi:MAG: transposase [Thaumarchaeota archaeon]|nr:transposase [Nitrososphaerota archaeon]
MYRSDGLRIHMKRSPTRHVSSVRESQRQVYNWAIERLLADPTLTQYDLQNEFTELRRSTPWLQATERVYQDAAIVDARTAADISNLYGKGNLKFRSRKKNYSMAVVCNRQPRFMDNSHASLPGIGVIRLDKEQPYQYPHNWLHGSRAFHLVDVTPRSWKNVKPGDRIYRLRVVYDLPEPERASTGVAAGIDRGITNPTVVCKSDGKKSIYACFDTAVAFRSNQSWNDEARRTISRRNKHSRTTKKIKRQRDSYNWHNANARDYAEWLLAKEICYGVDVICIEGLDLDAITRAGGASKRGLNRGLRYVRHGMILKKVRIVAERMGIRIIEVDPRGTSQECCACSYRHKENRKGERFLCLACGRLDNADRNASANVTQRGTGMKVPAGEGIALERRELGRARKPPRLAQTAPDAMRRRENQACNRPATSSAAKHLGRYAYVTCADSGI